jgi:hypothetical protein
MNTGYATEPPTAQFVSPAYAGAGSRFATSWPFAAALLLKLCLAKVTLHRNYVS